MTSTMKRSFSFILVLALCLSIMAGSAFAAQGSMENFIDKNAYTEGHFIDIGGEWFEGSVARGYALGLIDGKGDGVYDPYGNVTLAESIKLAACLHSIYYTGTTDFVQGDPWYQVYVNYCLSKGIITSGYADYNVAATRAQFATIFANSLPASALPAINTVNDNCIPDVKITDSYGPSVYKLYRAGILTGSDAQGTFNPQSNIQRSEMAAIVTRMADADLRKPVTLTEEAVSGGLTAQQIFEKCSSAVFYIEIYDRYGSAIASGSGVFTSSDGQAVTCHHVIEDAYSAKITTTDGSVYDVAGVYDYDANTDLARLQINGSGFSYLPIGDSRNLSTGANVFAIGSPLGLDNTISQGIISNANRVVDGLSYIQTTAPISSGSSGGALINDQGELIGITSAQFKEGQNLNLAVPIHRLEELGYTSWSPLPLEGAYQPATLSFNTSLTVSRGSTATVMMTVDPGSYTGEYYLQYNIANTSIVSCSWGDWQNGDTNMPLYVTGRSTGSTTVTITYFTTDDEYLDSDVLYVTVGGSSGGYVSYYPGYYPAPDFGAWLGISAYYNLDGDAYLYRQRDIPDVDYAIDGYVDLLESCGFSYYTDFIDDNGYTVVCYRNGSYAVTVSMNAYYFNGYSCLMIGLYHI